MDASGRGAAMSRRLAGLGAAALFGSWLAVGCATTARPPFDLVAQAYEIQVEGSPAIRAGGLVVASYNLRQMVRPDALHADLAKLAFVDVWAMQEVPVPRPPGRSEDQRDDH